MNLLDQVCGNRPVVEHGSIVLILLVEAWLGKTSQIKSGSILELVFSLLRRVFVRAKQGEKDGKSSSSST